MFIFVVFTELNTWPTGDKKIIPLLFQVGGGGCAQNVIGGFVNKLILKKNFSFDETLEWQSPKYFGD